MTEVERIASTTDVLGESPVWCDRQQALYWADVRGPFVRRYDIATRETRSWPFPELVGSIALRESGHELVIALATSLAIFDPRTGGIERIASPEAHVPHRRFNDGCCDRQGRFWAGTMHDETRAPEGTLYRLDANRRCCAVFNGIRAPNSLAWSPDGRTMYFADSYLRAIFSYPFDPEAGTVGERRVFAELRAPAMPDGSTIDAEGCLWNAEYDGGRITRYTPDGRVDRVVEVPLQRPTSCAFGGAGLRTLFVTTASQKLSEAERKEQPLAGAVLAIEVGVAGIAEPRYLG
jgi:sugar lactone lactonase YvrE